VTSVPFTGFPVDVRSDLLEALRSVWRGVAAAGTWWSGPERVAIAEAARGGENRSLPTAAGEAARRIYADITSTSRAWAEGLVAAGLGMPAYVEIVGVVGRLSAVDEFTRAVGGPLEPLPDPEAGEASMEPPPAASPGRSWVPMVGGMSITQALSLVPEEHHAQRELHGPLYLTYEQMDDLTFKRELTRPQMELVAARISAINECFY
jgi:hypothetical protein